MPAERDGAGKTNLQADGSLSTPPTASEGPKFRVAILKIIFSHVQVVAIAASFDLRWPPALMEYFNTLNTATSVASDVLSLDCFLQDETAAVAIESNGDVIGDAGDALAASRVSGGTSGAAGLDGPWPHIDEAAVAALTASQAERHASLISLSMPDGGLAAAMPSGSSFLAKSVVVLLMPLLLVGLVALLWLMLEASDGCLFEEKHDDDRAEQLDKTEQDTRTTGDT